MVMRTLLVLTLVSVLMVTKAAAITNQEFYELLTENLEDEVVNYASNDDDDVTTSTDDDILDLPGNADDEVDVEYLMSKLFLDSSPKDDLTADVGRGRCGCRRYSCQCCVRKTWKVKVWRKRYKAKLNACLKVAYLPRDYGFRVTFTVNGRRLFKREVSLRHPPGLCFRIPGLGRFARVCLEFYNVNFRRKSVCARISGRLNLVFKKFRVRLKLGCFRIPVLHAEWLQEVNQPTDDGDTDVPEIIEFFRKSQDDDSDGGSFLIDDDLLEM